MVFLKFDCGFSGPFFGEHKRSWLKTFGFNFKLKKISRFASL
jgi:hypothetical protein